ncbi:glycosyl transferase family 2 [Pasteurella atlantica]|uniref:LpxL/LpxP family acyltransferase n=1 Tax=Pasteurellaceae TaxID=712 RepID=UPI0027511466|nr:glycosyl transferase family 2 [Pasteurella atlantica]MDP8098899.1 glycosyl transferase family 2 [Pasteurella atlantica]MDP8100216.1 glycosyl transferase family 2 [Pasteurella atlantica]MDP8106926.1 glycosyl transferase family 2 [Pasteurella atlantica]MDP8116616.1 glycosyl transferase family 2 [Pasteurella atlantica]
MNTKHWAKQNERGTVLFLDITRLIVKYLPLWAIKITTILVVCYFFVTSAKVRKNIRAYHHHLTATFTDISLPKFVIFRQLLCFGEALTDRFAVWQNKMSYNDLLVDDKDNLYSQMEQSQRGQILVCGHFGNIEICRALVNSGHHANFKLNILVHHKNAVAFNKALVKAGASELSLIEVSELDTVKMLELHNKLAQGEWIAIAVDRIPLKGDKSLAVDFLGKKADFPQGAWLLSSLLKAPINTIFCLKENGKYILKLRRFSEALQGSGQQRKQNIAIAMQQYADLLAQECKQNPLLWFNFYDFWDENDES